MGCSPGDNECYNDEKPPKTVQIPSGFWIGQTEVTQAAWLKVMSGKSPSKFKGDRLPVERVTFDQADDYCRKIGGSLPTEQQWEYAARAGSTAAPYGSLDAVAWYSGNSGNTTHPVGQKQANAFGLYDMLGNVWEWTSSEYAPGLKVVRGGSWYNDSRLVRASLRSRDELATRGDNLGFRCAGDILSMK
jgi:formylglycine-generating enzyme required for sulfatase activity